MTQLRSKIDWIWEENTLRITAEFREGKVLVDPVDSVTMIAKKSNVEFDIAVERDSLGLYIGLYTPPEAGQWVFTVRGSGDSVFVTEPFIVNIKELP